MFHQTGCFDDPKGGKLRAQFAQRLRLIARFKNELLLFSGIKPERSYCLSISCGSRSKQAKFISVSNLYHPATLDSCWSHDGYGPVPLIKNDEGEWILSGHHARLIEIDELLLGLFAELFDPPGTPPLEARLPVVHSRENLSVLEKFVNNKKKLGDFKGEYFATVCFDEAYAEQDGTIKRETVFPTDASEWVVSGPHFYVGTPLYKTPRAQCRLNTDYDVIDLTQVPDSFLPRTNYIPACSPAEYERRTPRWNGKPVTKYYRYANRTMIAPTGERTLIPCILPPRVAHIDLVFSIAFSDLNLLIGLLSIASTIPGDFFVKTTGKTHARIDVLGNMPIIDPSDELMRFCKVRILRLNCLTTHYVDLWGELYEPRFLQDGFVKQDPRLPAWSHLASSWHRTCAFRTPYERRQALVELDVLAAMALGLAKAELLTIYRVAFGVMRRYEQETYYDQRGHIVFTTNSKGLNGVGFSRPEWEQIKHLQSGTVERKVIDDTLPGGPRERTIIHEAPFDRCDREQDYEIVWAEFERRLGGKRAVA